MRGFSVVVAASVVAGLACGGAGAGAGGGLRGSAEPAHGSVAYQTYVAGSDTVRFRTETETTKTWKNMGGKPVEGTFTHSGADIVVLHDPKFDNNFLAEERFRQLDECSIARNYTRRHTGEVDQSDSRVFERTVPKCPKSR